jgi:predicted nucleic acid-binding protein
VPEDGTGWVQNVVDPQSGHDIYIAEITLVEVISAVKKRERTTGLGQISKTDAIAFISQFRDDFDKQYLALNVKSKNVEQAADLVEKHNIFNIAKSRKLRAYDAIQLAVAVELYEDYQTQSIPVTFISADIDLLEAASAEGLQTENPNDYP